MREEDTGGLGKARTLSGSASRITQAPDIGGLGDSRRINYGPDIPVRLPVVSVPDESPLETDNRSWFPGSVIPIPAGGYEVTLNPGRVIEYLTGGAPPDDLTYPDIYINDGGWKLIDADPAPKLIMNLGDTAFLQYKTDIFGNINTDPGDWPQVIAAPGAIASTHYQPDPGTPIPGEMYEELFTLAAGPGSSYIIVPHRTSDVEHRHELPTMRNVGGFSELVKERNPTEDTYDFRTTTGRYGVTELQSDDLVTTDLALANVGEGCPVWVEVLPEDFVAAQAEFRSIDGSGASDQQINVECDDETIRITGNGAAGAILLQDGAVTTDLIRWADGLVTANGEITLQVEELDVCVSGVVTTKKFVTIA